MHPRSMVALGVGGLAAAVALVFGIARQMGVKSYGYPAGRVVRAAEHLCVLIQTKDPYIPSMKGRNESDMSYSYSLWLIPEIGDGDTRTIRLDRGVRSGDRTHNIGAQKFDSGILWLTINDLKGIEVSSGKKVSTPAPASVVNTPISQLMGTGDNPLEGFRAQGITLASGERLFLINDDEVGDLKPGTRLDDNPDAKPSYKPRTLHSVAVEPGPIPRLASVSRLADREFRRGAFLRAQKNGTPIQFTGPDGFLVVHEQGDPVHPTICLSRVSIDGSIVWTADTGLGRVTQVLPHERLPCFVGEPPQQLTEPTLAVVDLKDGVARTRSLKRSSN